jgi:hypothetical protein
MKTDKYISSKDILNRVIRDGGYKAHEISYADSLEWIAECLDLIAVPHTLLDKIAILKVENHKAVLPCDYESVTQATGLTKGGVQFAMRGANNTFHPLFFSSANNLPFIDGVNPIGTDENGNPIFNFMNYDAAISKQLIAELPYTFKDVTYKINDNYIITTFKEGASVLMAYKAFPVDEDGYPLIPDNEKFKQAVQWYIMYKLAFRTWIKGALTDKVFNYVETQRDWYIGAATTSGLTPTYDQMESWKNEMLKLLPRFNSQSGNFNDLGTQEFYTGGQRKFRY